MNMHTKINSVLFPWEHLDSSLHDTHGVRFYIIINEVDLDCKGAVINETANGSAVESTSNHQSVLSSFGQKKTIS